MEELVDVRCMVVCVLRPPFPVSEPCDVFGDIHGGDVEGGDGVKLAQLEESG